MLIRVQKIFVLYVSCTESISLRNCLISISFLNAQLQAAAIIKIKSHTEQHKHMLICTSYVIYRVFCNELLLTGDRIHIFVKQILL